MPKAESRKSKGSRTLRGFIAGEEPDEENFFPFSASLRVFGDSVPFEELTQRLGVQATHAHRKAERRGSKIRATARMGGYISHHFPKLNRWNAILKLSGKL